jgi:crotonobetainyl-CoA:carnitine CoA-transferase CaiB-like acyl-CoA transferase
MMTFAGWGERGVYQGYATLGSGPDAWVGHHYLRTYRDLEPTSTGPSYHADSVGALTIAFALMAALRHRDRTGEGRFMDLSMAEILLTHMPRPVIDWALNNRVSEPLENEDPEVAPHGCYPCKDDDSWAVIAVRTDEQWQGLKRALGHPSWAEDSRLDSVAGRREARREIDEHLKAWTRERAHVEVMHLLQAESVPAGPVYRSDETVNDPHLAARDYYRWVLHPVTGQYKRPGPIFNLPKTPVHFRRPTNLLGEHNQEVFCGLLGLSETDYESLLEEQIVWSPD